MNKFMITPEFELEVCNSYKGGESINKIRRRLHKSEKSIIRILESNEIEIGKTTNATARTRKRLEPLTEQICQDYQDGCSMLEMSRKYETTAKFIRGILKKCDVILRTTIRKYSINETFFERIDSEAKAYFLGFLCADGGIFNNRMSLTLQVQDANIIESFRESVNYTGPLYYWDKRSSTWSDKISLSCYNKKICDDLAKLGCTEKKSLTLQFPTKEQVPVEFLSHFLRGIFDGDGCISIHYPSLYPNKLTGCVSIVSSTCWCEEAVKIFKEYFNIDLNFYRAKGGNELVSTLASAKIETLEKLYHLFYDNATLFLPRKFIKFNEFFQFRLNFKTARATIANPLLFSSDILRTNHKNLL